MEKDHPLKSTFREEWVHEEIFCQRDGFVELRFELEVRSDATQEKAEEKDLKSLEWRSRRRRD
jgi:hypothetical protein